MNPQTVFCPNQACPSRGLIGAGNIGIKSQKERRYTCKSCGKSFAETTGTPLFSLKKADQLFFWVVTLLGHGCPPQAIVAAFGLDIRTVLAWQAKAGGHCQRVHQALVEEQPRDLGQVQADEIRVKMYKRLIVWMAMAIQVPTRLWLGGEISPQRDKRLIQRLADKVKSCALFAAILLVTDGLASYVSAWRRSFRTPVWTGKKGRPLLLAWPQVVIGQVVKRYQSKHVVGVEQRLVQGTKEQQDALLPPGQQLNSAYIERLNATFRACLFALVRRSRALAHQVLTLQAGMYLIGTVYNFCTPHNSLRQEQAEGTRKWLQRTPAMSAGITDHCWSMAELMTYRIPPPAYVPPKRRGRKPKSASQPILAGGPA